MPTYVYETSDKKTPARQFEVRQSIRDAALTRDPETGRPVRRMITGGVGIITGNVAPSPSPRPRGGGCGAGCGCHHH